MLRIIFTFFVGAILALFMRFSIHTFYPPPKPADTSIVQLKANPTDEEVAKAASAQKADDTAYKAAAGACRWCRWAKRLFSWL